MLVGWIIHVCISHQSDLGFYQGPIKLRLVYMDRFYEYLFWVQARENEGTERDFEGAGRDMSIPLKLYLEMRTSTETYFRLWKNH